MPDAPDAAIDQILRGKDLATFKGVQAIAPILIPKRNAVTVENLKVARHCLNLYLEENLSIRIDLESILAFAPTFRSGIKPSNNVGF